MFSKSTTGEDGLQRFTELITGITNNHICVDVIIYPGPNFNNCLAKSLARDEYLHPTPNSVCDYLSIPQYQWELTSVT